jgi:SAM-dependent methyltransferase
MVGDRHRAAWEDWGRVDPYWAVLSWPDMQGGNWDADRFFATGEEAVEMVLAHAGRLGRPAEHRVALDFGCGLGRLTRALAPRFERAIGLDIASTMVAEARRIDAERGPSGTEFVVHEPPALEQASGSVDLVMCLLVLQHLPSSDEIAGYVREFVRVLAPGGVAVVQIPVSVPAPGPDPLRVRAKRSLRALGLSPRFLYGTLGWQPEMRMRAMPYDDVVAVVEEAGGSVLDAPESSAPGDVVSRLYFLAGSAR